MLPFFYHQIYRHDNIDNDRNFQVTLEFLTDSTVHDYTNQYHGN